MEKRFFVQNISFVLCVSPVILNDGSINNNRLINDMESVDTIFQIGAVKSYETFVIFSKSSPKSFHPN